MVLHFARAIDVRYRSAFCSSISQPSPGSLDGLIEKCAKVSECCPGSHERTRFVLEIYMEAIEEAFRLVSIASEHCVLCKFPLVTVGV